MTALAESRTSRLRRLIGNVAEPAADRAHGTRPKIWLEEEAPGSLRPSLISDGGQWLHAASRSFPAASRHRLSSASRQNVAGLLRHQGRTMALIGHHPPDRMSIAPIFSAVPWPDRYPIAIVKAWRRIFPTRRCPAWRPRRARTVRWCPV